MESHRVRMSYKSSDLSFFIYNNNLFFLHTMHQYTIVTRSTCPHELHWTWITSGRSLAFRLVSGNGDGISKIRHRLQLKDLHATSIAKFLFCERNVDILEGGSETTVPLFNSNIVLLLFRLFSYDSFTMCCCFTAGILTRVITASLEFQEFFWILPRLQTVKETVLDRLRNPKRETERRRWFWLSICIKY